MVFYAFNVIGNRVQSLFVLQFTVQEHSNMKRCDSLHTVDISLQTTATRFPKFYKRCRF